MGATWGQYGATGSSQYQCDPVTYIYGSLLLRMCPQIHSRPLQLLPGAWVNRSLLGAWCHKSHLGLWEFGGTRVSWGLGFMVAHQDPDALEAA